MKEVLQALVKELRASVNRMDRTIKGRQSGILRGHKNIAELLKANTAGRKVASELNKALLAVRTALDASLMSNLEDEEAVPE